MKKMGSVDLLFMLYELGNETLKKWQIAVSLKYFLV